MTNSLIDVSITTMIGNLPGIINRNNDSLEAEFDSLFYYSDASVKKSPVLKVDVSSNNISAQVGYFRNINIGGRTIDASLADKYVQLDSSVRNLEQRVTVIEETNNGSLQVGVYGSSSQHIGGYDMSSFWNSRNAALDGAMVENLIFERPYCIRDGVVVPLYVGTIEISDRTYSTVYYDHIDDAGDLWRIYVPIQTALDGNTVIPAGNPGRIKINVVK